MQIETTFQSKAGNVFHYSEQLYNSSEKVSPREFKVHGPWQQDSEISSALVLWLGLSPGWDLVNNWFYWLDSNDDLSSGDSHTMKQGGILMRSTGGHNLHPRLPEDIPNNAFFLSILNIWIFIHMTSPRAFCLQEPFKHLTVLKIPPNAVTNI